MRPVLVLCLVVTTLLISILVLAQQTFTSDRRLQNNEEVNNSKSSNNSSVTSWISASLRRFINPKVEGSDFHRIPRGFLNYHIEQQDPKLVRNIEEIAYAIPSDDSLSPSISSIEHSNQQEPLHFSATISPRSQATIDQTLNSISVNQTFISLQQNTHNKQASSSSLIHPMRESFVQLKKPLQLKTGNMTAKDSINQITTDDFQNLVRCNNNKYDKLIAQKLSLNELSRPIIDSNGRFDNPFSTWKQPSMFEVAKFVALEQDGSDVPKNRQELNKELPLLKPNFNVKQSNEFRVTWIGHSTLLIQVDGLNILTDPIFSDRASFSQYFGPKRIREPACDIKSLPRIDIVLISHNHYDHLDTNSVKQINERFGSGCRWVIPLGLGEYFQSLSVENYVELDWWQKDCFQVKTSKSINNQPPNDFISIRSAQVSSDLSSSNINQVNKQATDQMELDIYMTPTQHWTRRGVNDVNKTLWGSYVIVSKSGSTFFFGGDTAYCSAFKEIGNVFGPFVGAAIPIGAYKPRWFLKYSHVDPNEAVQIHRELRSFKSIAIHHSTFILANEHYKEPSKLLYNVMSDLKAKGLVKEPFIALKHGETTEFSKLP